MRYIDLVKNHGFLGRFDVPEHITSESREIFRLKSAILTGSNGVVFAANHMKTYKEVGRNCAVKLLRQKGASRLDRFDNEVRVLRELDSRFISKYFDSGEVTVTLQTDSTVTESVPWVAIQRGGANMRQHIELRGALSLPELKALVPGICEAVSHLHGKGFIHRDIKPDNFVWNGEHSGSLLMIDFGIAKRNNEDVSGRPMDAFTQISEFVGPVFFSSPELIEYARNKRHPVDYRSDIFQVGKVLWYLATTKISAGIPSRKECPAGGKLRDLVIAMIDDDPNGRPQTLAEVEAAIAAI
jgi:serine/threonine-protein kinase